MREEGEAEVAVVWDGWKVATYREALMWEIGGAVGKEADGDSEGAREVNGRGAFTKIVEG